MNDDNITNRIYALFKEKDSFLTLKDLYSLYAEKFDTSEFKDYTSVIRRHIYSRCIDRDIKDDSKKPLFFSLSPKKTRGNQYGIIEWYVEEPSNDINTSSVNEIISKLPMNPSFDSVEIVEYNDLKKSSVYTNTRKLIYATQALVQANFLCEYENEHKSFIRKTNGKNYTEAHHLIPLSSQKDFKYSLDVPANIISLCSNCHNQLHYGQDFVHILKKLYALRIDELKKYKIECTLKQLCMYYGVESDE